MKSLTLIIALIASLMVVWNSEEKTEAAFADQNVYDVLQALGDDTLNHELRTDIPGVSAENGKELFLTGYITNPDGKQMPKQSKHYVCTSCHLNVMEDFDLGNTSPEARLNYAVENGLPFLQGTTLYGAVNRKTFYNGDYKKKYGQETVDKVKNDLRESIQLCAVGCAQGRALDTWEIESVLAYFWTLQLKMGDLNISKGEMAKINAALEGDGDEAMALDIIHGKYYEAAPATFGELPEDIEEGYAPEGDAANGETIFQISCMHCHQNGRYSYYSLDTNTLDMKHLSKHFSREKSPYNSYKLIVDGTLPVTGNKAYMPQYPLERMSPQQIEDLRAYVDGRSE